MADRPEENVHMATISRPKRQRICLRLCHRYRFDDSDIEDLYERYVFQLQRTSLQCLLVLLIALCVSVAVLDFIFVAYATVENISHLAMSVVFTILLIFIHTRFMTYSQIPIAGYLVAFLCLCLAAVALPVNYMDQDVWKFTAVDGVWRLCYLILATYAFLPLRICVGILVGLALPSAHTALCILNPVSYQVLLWRQLTANAIIFIAVNIVGIYIHDRREHAQRKVFSNIRACVAGRMHMEDENEKLERMLNSILPPNIAMEMKNDVKHPRDDVVLQNVYAQKHNSVSILSADISGFSALVSQCSALELVQVINEIMGRFDQLASETHCVRVRLHGDGYFAVCGVPDARPDHAKCCVELGLDMTHVIGMVREATDMDLGLRVGVHSGSVLCGVIGTKKWQYDVWSDDVHVAKHLETSGVPGRVHVSHTTVEYLHGEFGVEALPGQESFLIVADHPRRARHSRVSLASSKLNGAQSVHSLVKSAVKGNSDIPLTTIMLGQKEDKQNKKNVTDKMLRPFKRLDRVPSDRVERYLASAIDTKSIDKMKTDHVNYVSLKFKNHSKERRYLRQDDSSFPTVMLLSLIMLVLSSAMQALVLPRTLLLILLFIVSFTWVAVILILLLGSRLKCIGCDLQESAILRVLIMTVTILFVYSVSQVNVYIYLSGIMGYLLICIFMKLTSLAKVLLMLFVAAGYVAVMEYTHQSIFKAMDTIMRPPVPTDVVGILALVHCLVLLFVQAREFEWIHRLAFLWKDQAREEREETMDIQLVNRRLLGNVLPVHVALFYLDPLQLSRDYLDIYCRPYSRVGIMFASIPNFGEFYSQMDSNNRGADCLKVLNDIIGDFDELLDQDHFKAVEKLKTMGTCYMAAVGLNPERTIHETEQSTALYLSVLVEFVMAMREKLEINNNSYCTRFQLRVGMNVGPTVAGVVGAKRPQFDLYGQAVNIASLMEARGQAGFTQVTDAVYRPLRERYQFQCRGPTQINHRSELLTYFLTGRIVGYRPELHVSMIESMTESQMSEMPRDLSLILPVMGSSDKIRLLESQDMARSSPKTAVVREGSIRSNTSASGSIGSHGMPNSVPGIQIRARIDENAPLITKNTPPGSLNRKRKNSGCRESSRKQSGSSLTNFLALPQMDPNHMRVESPDLPMVHYRNTSMPGNGSNICRSESLNSGTQSNNLTQSQILSMGMMTPPPVSPTEDRATPLSPRGGTPSTGRSSVASVISVKARESPQRLGYANGNSDPNLNRSGSNGALASPIYVNTKNGSMNSSSSFVLPCIEETSESKSCSDGGVSSPNSGELLGQEFDELNKIMKELDRKGLRTPDSDSTLNGYSHHNKAYSRYSPVVINGRTPNTSTTSPLHPPVAASSVEVKNAPLVSLMSRHHSFPDQSENGHAPYKKQNSAPSGLPVNGVSKVIEMPKEEEEEEAKANFMLGPGKYDTASSCATKYDNASSTSGTGQFDNASIDYLKYRLKESAEESDRSPPPLPPPPPDEFFVPNYTFQLQAPPSGKKKQNDLSHSAFLTPDKQLPPQKKPAQKNIPSQHLLEVPKVKPSKGKNKVVKDKKNVFTPPYNIVTGEPSKPIQTKGTPPYRRTDQGKQAHPKDKPTPSPQQQVKRRHLTKTPPRLCRSLERMSSDVEESASRESSRAQSPKDGRMKQGHYDFYLPFGANKSHLLPDNISLSSIGSSEMSKSDPALNYSDSGSTAYESEYDNYRPGMASDEDYFVPEPISDIDIDIFDELNVDDVEISDKYSIDMPMPRPIRQKIVTDV